MATINIFGQTIEYETCNGSRNFFIWGILRWEITDKYGWNVKISEMRDIKLGAVLENIDITKKFLYNIALQKPDEEGWGHYSIFLDLYKGELKLSGEKINVTLKCYDFKKAEELTIMLMEGNNLELMPVSRSDFKSIGI